MFKEKGTQAYANARTKLEEKIISDVPKLKEFAKSKGIGDAWINTTSTGVIAVFLQSLAPSLGIRNGEFSYKTIESSTTLEDDASESIGEMEKRSVGETVDPLTDYNDCFRVWNFYCNEFGDFYKKVFINMVLFSTKAASKYGLEIQEIEVRESAEFSVLVKFGGGSICYIACDIAMVAMSGFDDASKMTHGNKNLFNRSIHFYGPLGLSDPDGEGDEADKNEVIDSSGLFSDDFGDRLLNYLDRLIEHCTKRF